MKDASVPAEPFPKLSADRGVRNLLRRPRRVTSWHSPPCGRHLVSISCRQASAGPSVLPSRVATQHLAPEGFARFRGLDERVMPFRALRFAFVYLDVLSAARAMNATHTNSVLRERGQQVSKDRQQLARIPPHIDTTIRLNSRSARISDGNDDDLAGIVSSSSSKTRTTMRAVELRDSFGIDSLTLTERPVLARESRGAGEGAGDVPELSGLPGGRRGVRPHQRLPIPPLSDGAGEVVETGPNVTARRRRRPRCRHLHAGVDRRPAHGRVPADGPGRGLGGVLAEYVVFNQQGVVRIPDVLTFEEAATLPCAAVTAWNALVRHADHQVGRDDPDPGDRRREPVRTSVRPRERDAGDHHLLERREAEASDGARRRHRNQLPQGP